MTHPIDLRIRESHWTELQRHLYPGDKDEHGAVLLCGEVRTPRSHRLLVREVIPAVDGIDYVAGTRGFRHLSGEFVTHQIRRAKDLELVYLAVHNHGGRGNVRFSPTDLSSHERGYPTLLNICGRPVGALVTAEDAVAGDIWLSDGSRTDLRTMAVIGDALTLITDGRSNPIVTDGTESADQSHVRQSLVFGDTGQRTLGSLRVGIIGAGGVGMLLVQALSRLGVGNLIVLDPDTVSVSNLSRLPEATLRDAGVPTTTLQRLLQKVGRFEPIHKVDLASRTAKAANPRIHIEALAQDVADDSCARRLRDCDFILLAADTMLARDVVNQLAYQYLIPCLQVGSKVVLRPETAEVLDVFGVVRSLGTTQGCMRCNGLIDQAKLSEEALSDPVQRQNQRYVDDPAIEAPSVITVNAMSAGWAANDFMQYATALGRPSSGFRVLRTQPVGSPGQHVTVQTPAVDANCHVCGLESYSAMSRGDGIDLPTRVA